MKELIHKRTLTSKIFETNSTLLNGKFHIGHIHYPSGIDKNGVLENVDTTLSFNASSGIWSMTKASYEAEIGLYGDVRFHNVDGMMSITVPNTSKIEGIYRTNDAWGDLGKSLIWPNLLGNGMHQIVEVRNGSLARIFRFEQKPSFNSIDMIVEMSNLTFNNAPTVSNDLRTSNKLILPTAFGKQIHLRQPSAWNHRGERVPVEFRFYLSGGKIHLEKIIPQSFIDNTFTEQGAWLETDDVTSYYTGAGDGYSARGVVDSVSWSDLRSNSTGNDVNYTSATTVMSRAVWRGAQNDKLIYRGFLPTDTSGLGAGATVTAATLKTYTWLRANDAGSTVAIVQTSQASPTSLSNADYSAITLDSPDEGATRKTYADLASGAYVNWTLNANGISWIDVEGYSYFGTRDGAKDIDNVEPPDGGTDWYLYLYMSEQTGTSQDPYLDITFIPENKIGLTNVYRIDGISQLQL